MFLFLVSTSLKSLKLCQPNIVYNALVRFLNKIAERQVLKKKNALI